MRIAFTETTVLKLKHPITEKPLINSKGESMSAVIYGRHTPIFQDVMDEMKINQEKELSAEDNRKEALKLLSLCVSEFRNIELETESGVIDGASIESCLGVFWIKEQIDSAVMDRELFLEPSKAI